MTPGAAPQEFGQYGQRSMLGFVLSKSEVVDLQPWQTVAARVPKGV